MLVTSKKAKEKSVANLELASALFQFAYEIKFYQLKLKNPDLSESEIHKQTLDLFEKASNS